MVVDLNLALPGSAFLLWTGLDAFALATYRYARQL